MTRSPDYLGATGIGVSDLEASATFYRAALGMKELRRITLPYMDEIILGHDGRAALVLMHWTDGSDRHYRNLPIKLVFYVTSPEATAANLVEAGGTVTFGPAPVEAFGGAMIGLCKDLDGYVVELLQAPS